MKAPNRVLVTRLAGTLLIPLAVAAAYWNALDAQFVFDDFAAIVENETIRALGPAVLSPPPNTGVSGRPLINATLALNYAVGGLEPRGYHLFNIAIHALAALVLRSLLRRAMALARIAVANREAVALGSALVWAIHPLQTESVTCVVQRTEVVVGLFYLLTFHAFVRSMEPGSGSTRWWQAAAIAGSALGMASKEVMATAPVLMLLFDRTFVAGSIPAAWRARSRFYVALAATWVLLVPLVFGAEQRGGTAGFGLGVGVLDYALTQCRAISLYVERAIWPHPLVLDYGREIVRDPLAVLPHAIVLGLLLALSGRALWRRAPAGFAGAWFFLILAPSSSVVPLTTQTIAEHRMYLPLAALTTLGAVGLARLIRGRALACRGGAAVAAGLLTAVRNHDYRSELAVWSDTVAKAPRNPRAHNNLGLALGQEGRTAEAEAHFVAAVRLDANYSPAHANLADRLHARGDLRAAVEHYQVALRISPAYASVHYRLANALAQLGEDGAALSHYEAAAQLDPGDARKQHALGAALLKAGRPADAADRIRTALRIDPTSAEAWNNLGTAQLAQGDFASARENFERALQEQPDYTRARANLQRLEELQRRRGGARD